MSIEVAPKRTSLWDRCSGPATVLALLCVGLVGATNAGLLIFGQGDSAGTYTIYRALGLAVVAALVAVRWRPISKLLLRERSVLLFSLWSLITIAWSQNVHDSAVGLAVLATQIVLAAALATEFSPVKSMGVVAWILSACSVISVALIVIIPSVGTKTVDHVTAGRITQGVGVFGWNSELGIAAGLGAVLCAALWIVTRQVLFVPMLLVNAAALYLTDSATSIMGAVAGLGALGFIAFRLIRMLTVVGVVGAGVLFVVGRGDWILDKVLGAFNRTSNLSGREGIWTATLDEIQKEPWLGHGIGTSPDYMLLILRTLEHAHNGYLQVTYDRGLIGAALLALVLLITVFRLWRATRNTQVLAIPVLTVVLVTNYVNNYLVSAGLAALLLYWVVFVAQVNESEAHRTPELRFGPRRRVTPEPAEVVTTPCASASSERL